MAYGTLFTDIYNNFKIMLQSLYVYDNCPSAVNINVDLNTCIKNIFYIPNNDTSIYEYVMKLEYGNISNIKSIYIIYNWETDSEFKPEFGFYGGELIRFVLLNKSTVLRNLLRVLNDEADFIKSLCPYGTKGVLEFASVTMYCKLMQEVLRYDDDEYVLATLKKGIIENGISFTTIDKLLQGYIFFMKNCTISHLLDYSGILSISNTIIEALENLESEKKE